MIKFKLDTVNERDMDLFFAQAVLDPSFFHFVLEKFVSVKLSEYEKSY